MCWQQLRVQGKPRRDNNALKRHFLSSNAFPVKAPFFFPIVPSSIGAEKKAVLTTRVGSVHNSLGSCLLKVCFYSQLQLDGEEACQPVRLASDENEKKGAQVQFYHLSSFKKKKKKNIDTGTWLSCSQIYLDSSTNEIKHSLYQGLLHEEQHTMAFIASPVLSLTLTSESALQPKSTLTI